MARLQRFPVEFMFGVANSDHQCEAYVPGTDDIWDAWEQQPHQPPVTPRGNATDFWRRYPGDVKLAQEMGCTAFRLSIAWSRVEPRPGQYDRDALEHYRQACRTIRQAGMQPIVTLQHFTWPVHVEKRGGLTAQGFPETFKKYAEVMARCLHDQVRYWLTFNEPNQLVYGFIKPFWESRYASPPGLPPGATLREQMREIHKLIRNLFLAHRAARKAIQGIDGAALVGSNPLMLGLPSLIQWLVNRLVTHPASPEAFISQGKRFAEGSWLARGGADLVVATLTATRARAEQISFSEVYYVAGQRLLVKGGSSIRGVVDLAGKAVAVVETSTAAQQARGLLPQTQVRPVGDYAAARAALDSSQVEAILADDTILEGLRQENPNRYRLVGERLTTEPYAIAVKLGDRELLDHVNAALRRVRGYKRLLAPEPSAPDVAAPVSISESQLAQVARDRLAAGGPLPLAEPGTALRRIQERGYLVAAVRDDVRGFGYRDPQTGQYSGLEIDLARAVARQILGDPAKVEFRATTTAQRIPSVRSFWQVLDPIMKPVSVLSTIFYANSWHLGMAGRLPEALCPKGCAYQQDFVGRALIVGINTYGGGNDLHACVADATAMAEVLSRHKDGEKNFDCIMLLDQMEDGSQIIRPRLRAALYELFNFDGEVLLYFSGHGFLSKTGGLLCTSDATKDDWGIPMQEVVDLANGSQARQILVILDCCHSGDIANPTTMNKDAGKTPLATLRENMTVIAASHATQAAIEASGHGLFTGALLDALEGGAADHMGFVTAPALYAYVSRRFTAWDQRPVYKTNATEVFTVRECEPLINRLQLRQLATYFPKADSKFRLDPEYEPEDEHGNVKEPVNKDKVAIAQLFKSYRDAGLLVPSDPKLQLYWVARRSETVELTPRGREYRWLVVKDKI